MPESVPQQLLGEILTQQLTSRHPPDSGGPGSDATVLDVGGGTGITATALARLGYSVTVVDPSPDALASLARRSGEQGVAERVSGVQGDASDLTALVAPGSVDIVVCHRVLDVVDSPAEALASIATTMSPGGLLSLLVVPGPAVVLAQGLAGHFAQADRLLADPRRLRYEQIVELVTAAGLGLVETHGIGAVADHVPAAVAEAGRDELLQLERSLSADETFHSVAPQLLLLAERPE